ncbi:glycosyltransferase [Pseudoalteromonas spongiae]|uniref:glycosyltransferase n=1 Tax=Pseudoalteromonas spongiae TaxID=298657 RepID=UPI00026CD43B|nr:glycosyltransferase [Pseudoalteromonas spongiae]ATC97649.1 hypothetical protein PSPO_a0434 [Pseudoalteromonas spongiae UST010723-006]
MTILYDFLEVAGGAEKVSLDLAQHLNCPLIVSGTNKDIFSAFPEHNVNIINIGKVARIPIWKTINSINAFERIKTEQLTSKKILFSGSNAPVAVHKSQAEKNIYYCHTPPRFAYDLYDHYQNTLPSWQAYIVDKFATWVRQKYEPTLPKMDLVIANSNNVKARLKKYLNVDATVIYPPVHIEEFFNSSSSGYYLSTARLEEYKRIQTIVDAFKQLPNKKLVLVSGGSMLDKLKIECQNYSNIEIVGWASQEMLRKYISECIATIYIPIDEDFGMSPVESMAAGKPVIGVNDGGIKETVRHQETGYLCPADLSTSDLIDAIEFLTPNKAQNMMNNCIARAQSFKADLFFSQMKEIMT